MKILDRYLQANIMQASAVVLLVVAALSLVSSFLGEADELGSGDYNLPQIIQYMLLSLPDNLHLVFPLAALLGSLLALGALAAGSELIVIRATGVSAVRLAWSVGRTGLLLAAISLLFGEVLGPSGVELGEKIQDRAKHGDAVQEIGDGLWLRDGKRFVRIKGTLTEDTLADIQVYTLQADGSLRTLLSAKKARYQNKKWRLLDVEISRFSEDGVTIEREAEQIWDVEIRPEVLQLAVVKPEELSSWGLYNYIKYLRKNDVAANDYSLAFWRNIVAPITVLVLTVFALPFAFGSLRSTSAGQRLFAGGLVGIVFYMVNEITASGGVVYGLPPWLAASLPTMLLAIITAWWIRRIN